ncbi:hypothetical protein F4604DRAFT_1676346 [Suillus subluteus]|nr:hypothetical protein F4604DRAFT_1676346 [Suillus subluteus]
MDPNEMIKTHCDLEDLRNSLGSYPKPFQKAFKDACLLQKYTSGLWSPPQATRVGFCGTRMDQFNSLIIAQAVTIRFLAALIAILRNSAMQRRAQCIRRHEDAHSIHGFDTPSWTSSPPAFELSSLLPVASTVLDPRVLEGNQECDELQLSTTLKPPTLEHGISIHGEESVTRGDPWLCDDAFASPPPLAFECSSPVSVARTALDLPVLQENNAWDRFQISSAPKSLTPEHPELTEEDESMQSIDLWQYDDFITLPGEQGAEPEPTFDSFECSIATNDGLYSGDPWLKTGCDRGGLVLSGSEAGRFAASASGANVDHRI